MKRLYTIPTQGDPEAPEVALCREIDPEVWYDPSTPHRARAVCNSGCSLKAQCLADALDEESRERFSYGVRGGLLAHERRRLIIDARRSA